MIPTDSSDAAELREREQAQAEAETLDRRRHAAECVGGWLGLDVDERPRPCPRCRPHLLRVACRTCSVPAQSCDNLAAIRRGRCCDACDHQPAHERTT